MNAVLLVLVAILSVGQSFQHPISSKSKTSLFLWGKKVSTTKKAVGPSAEQHATAFKYWADLNGSMKETAPNFLTTKKCRSKFACLAATLGTIEGALLITQADPVRRTSARSAWRRATQPGARRWRALRRCWSFAFAIRLYLV
jgi:hypothetical protein